MKYLSQILVKMRLKCMFTCVYDLYIFVKKLKNYELFKTLSQASDGPKTTSLGTADLRLCISWSWLKGSQLQFNKFDFKII